MSTYQGPVDQQIVSLIKRFDISGTVSEGGPSSHVYDSQSRVFSIELHCGERHGCFAVYVVVAHPDIDLGFALRWLIDTAARAEDDTYERWLAENGSFYQTELGEEGRVDCMKKVMPCTANSNRCLARRRTALSVRSSCKEARGRRRICPANTPSLQSCQMAICA